jgi:hypothetical protein
LTAQRQKRRNRINKPVMKQFETRLSCIRRDLPALLVVLVLYLIPTVKAGVIIGLFNTGLDKRHHAARRR